jgi:hypothetical protein
VPGQLSRYSDGLWAGRLWVESQQGVTLFHMFRSVLRPAQPPIQCVPADLTPRVMQPGREANRLSPYSDEVKNCGAIIPLPSIFMVGARDSVLVKALCYKPGGRGFETRWDEWIFSIYLILPAALGPGMHSAYKRNEYRKQKSNVSGE